MRIDDMKDDRKEEEGIMKEWLRWREISVEKIEDEIDIIDRNEGEVIIEKNEKKVELEGKSKEDKESIVRKEGERIIDKVD